MENSGAAEEDTDVIDDDRPPNMIHSSTPLKYRDFENDKDAVIRAQAIQIKHLNFQLKESRHEVKKIKIDFEKQFNELSSLPLQERTNENNEAQMTMKHPTSIDPFRVHDRIYGFNLEQRCEEEIFDEKGNIDIGFGVYCNPTAYYDSFKGKNPYKCLYLLSQGVYDLKDLSERCVRRQSNTANKKVLSPKKTMAIERKVYAFMRIKDKTISQVDDFLDDLSTAHHNAITAAKKKLITNEKLNAEEAAIDRHLQELGNTND